MTRTFDDKNQFLEGFQMLNRKWRARGKGAMDWFIKKWATEAYCAWFSGFTPLGFPISNNAAERFNRSIKLYITSHKCLSFLKLMFCKELACRLLASHSSVFGTGPN